MADQQFRALPSCLVIGFLVVIVTAHSPGPGPPTQLNATLVTDEEIYLTWKHPVNSNGVVRFYYIRIYDTKTGQQVQNLVNKTMLEVGPSQGQLLFNLKPFTYYTFTIQAVTIKPGEMANFTVRTDEGVPSQPRDVRAKLEIAPSQPRDVRAKLENDAIVVTWKEPEDHNGILRMYRVFCDGTRDYNSSFRTSMEVVEAVSARRSVIKKEELKPGTKYSVYVKAHTAKGDGVGSDPYVLYTPSKAPPPPLPPRVVEDEVTPTTITISLTPSSDSYGKIILHQVIVEMVGKESKREANSVPDFVADYKEAQVNGDRFYIAAEFKRGRLPAEFILGNGETYGGHENAPLKPETQYKAYLRGVTAHNGRWLFGEPAEISLPPTGAVEKERKGLTLMEITIPSTLGSVFFILVATLAIVFFKKHRAGRKPNIPDDADEEEISPYATVHISSIFPLNAENNDPSNNDIPLEALPFQLRAAQEERRSGRAELQNSTYENTDHLGRPSLTPVEYLFYQPRYENETVASATSKVVIRPGYDKLTLAKREKRRCEYDSLIREANPRCKSRRGNITDSEGENNMNIHTIWEVPSNDERSLIRSMDKKKNQENSLGEIESERSVNVWKKETLV